jgi:hypothetical protein
MYEFDNTFQQQLELFGYAKSSTVYAGSSDISTPLSSKTREELKSFFGDPNVDRRAKFNVMNTMRQRVEEYNSSRLDERSKLGTQSFLSSVSTDGTLTRMSMIAKDDYDLGFSVYDKLNSVKTEFDKSGSYSKATWDNVKNTIDSMTAGMDISTAQKEAYTEIVTGLSLIEKSFGDASSIKVVGLEDKVRNYFKKTEGLGGNNVLVFQNPKSPKKDQGISWFKSDKTMGTAEYKAQIASQVNMHVPAAYVERDGKKQLVGLSFKDIDGRYQLVPDSLNLNKYQLMIAKDKEQARKGLYFKAVNINGKPIVIGLGEQ